MRQRDLSDLWEGYKRFSNTVTKQAGAIFDLQVKNLLLDPELTLGAIRSDAENPTQLISKLLNLII